MKIAILGDLHAGVHKGDPIFADALQRFITECFIPRLERDGVHHVVQLGDVVDTRHSISYVTMNRIRNDIVLPLMEAELEMHVIVGNHDIPYKNTLKPSAPIELFHGYDVNVYDEPREAKIGDLTCMMLPWICKENEEATAALMKRSKARVAFGHLELTGFDMYRGSPCLGGEDPARFQDLDLVVSGHFHEPSESGVITYLGAPAEYTRADAGCWRGFGILNTKTLKIEKVRNPFNVFLTFDHEDGFHLNGVDVKGKIVILKTGSASSQIGVDTTKAMLEKCGASSVRVEAEGFDADATYVETKIDGTVDQRGMISEYVMGMPENEHTAKLNRKKLETILLDVHAVAQGIV